MECDGPLERTYLCRSRENRARGAALLFLFQAEAINLGVVVHGVNAPIGYRQAAEVNPILHGVAALVKHLARPGIQRVKNAVAGILRPLGFGLNYQPLLVYLSLPCLVRVLPG